jgi:hypothetical protein
MKLELSTRINAISANNNSNFVIGSADLNMTFQEYINRCKKYGVPYMELLNSLLNIDYNLVERYDNDKYTFNFYYGATSNISSTFIELINK